MRKLVSMNRIDTVPIRKIPRLDLSDMDFFDEIPIRTLTFTDFFEKPPEHKMDFLFKLPPVLFWWKIIPLLKPHDLASLMFCSKKMFKYLDVPKKWTRLLVREFGISQSGLDRVCKDFNLKPDIKLYGFLAKKTVFPNVVDLVDLVDRCRFMSRYGLLNPCLALVGLFLGLNSKHKLLNFHTILQAALEAKETEVAIALFDLAIEKGQFVNDCFLVMLNHGYFEQASQKLKVVCSQKDKYQQFLVCFLNPRDSSHSPLHRAAGLGCLDFIRCAKESLGVTDINIKDESGRTVYCEAASNGKLEIMQWLGNTFTDVSDFNPVLEHGCVLSGNLFVVAANLGTFEKTKKSTGQVPYTWKEIAQTLDRHPRLLSAAKFIIRKISGSPSINLKDFKGMTPLHYAVSAKLFDVVELIIKGIPKGEPILLENDNGATPLDLASSEKMKQFIIQLCQRKAQNQSEEDKGGALKPKHHK